MCVMWSLICVLPLILLAVAKGSGRRGGSSVFSWHAGIGAWSVLEVAVAATVVAVALKTDVSEGAGGRSASLCIKTCANR